MNVVIAPSLLSADLARAALVCADLEKAGVSWLHLDVMDGAFVPNITFGAPFISCLRKATNLFFDVHLMIEEPGRYLEAFSAAGADLLVIHLETTAHPQLALAKIGSLGMKRGLALNPGTDFRQIRWLLPYLDLVLVMGVNPGFSGQKFIPETISKLKALRHFLDQEGYSGIAVEMDGGATPANVAELAEAGANAIVSGSAFFSENDFEGAMAKFRLALAGQDVSGKAIYENMLKWKVHGSI